VSALRLEARDIWEYHADGSRACVTRVQLLMRGAKIVDRETVPAYVTAAKAMGGDLSGRRFGNDRRRQTHRRRPQAAPA
jgi:hypothetical protein